MIGEFKIESLGTSSQRGTRDTVERDKTKIHEKRIRDNSVQAVNILSMVEYKEQAEAKHGHDVCRQREKEKEEVAVVPPANAVVYPWTVVVEVLQYGD